MTSTDKMFCQVADHPGQTASEIAKALGLCCATTARTLKRLVDARQLVRRQPRQPSRHPGNGVLRGFEYFVS